MKDLDFLVNFYKFLCIKYKVKSNKIKNKINNIYEINDLINEIFNKDINYSEDLKEFCNLDHKNRLLMDDLFKKNKKIPDSVLVMNSKKNYLNKRIIYFKNNNGSRHNVELCKLLNLGYGIGVNSYIIKKYNEFIFPKNTKNLQNIEYNNEKIIIMDEIKIGGIFSFVMIGYKKLNNKIIFKCMNMIGNNWGDNGYFYLKDELMDCKLYDSKNKFDHYLLNNFYIIKSD